jgi:hypothetical protein
LATNRPMSAIRFPNRLTRRRPRPDRGVDAMSYARQITFTLSVLVMLLGIRAPVAAEPFAAGDVIRLGFTIPDFVPRQELRDWDVFELALGFRGGAEPIGSFTTKIFDRGRLLGTFTGAAPGPVVGAGFAYLMSRFRSPASVYRLDDPAVIDMTSINDGTFNGWLEFTIARGSADIFRVSDELNGGAATSLDAASMSQWGFGASTFEVTPGVAPVPEPGSLLLLASGAAVMARRYARRRGPA